MGRTMRKEAIGPQRARACEDAHLQQSWRLDAWSRTREPKTRQKQQASQSAEIGPRPFCGTLHSSIACGKQGTASHCDQQMRNETDTNRNEQEKKNERAGVVAITVAGRVLLEEALKAAVAELLSADHLAILTKGLRLSVSAARAKLRHFAAAFAHVAAMRSQHEATVGRIALPHTKRDDDDATQQKKKLTCFHFHCQIEAERVRR